MLEFDKANNLPFFLCIGVYNIYNYGQSKNRQPILYEKYILFKKAGENLLIIRFDWKDFVAPHIEYGFEYSLKPGGNQIYLWPSLKYSSRDLHKNETYSVEEFLQLEKSNQTISLIQEMLIFNLDKVI